VNEWGEVNISLSAGTVLCISCYMQQ